jgi:hypothetical protein
VGGLISQGPRLVELPAFSASGRSRASARGLGLRIRRRSRLNGRGHDATRDASSRRTLDLDRVQQYVQMLDELPPIAVFCLEDQTLLLVDGYHRVAAAQKAGRTMIDADIREGTRADAVTFRGRCRGA